MVWTSLLRLSLFAAAVIPTTAASRDGSHHARRARGVKSQAVDYIIVGGGPAGFVLAEQLSLNPKTRVVLLEAGNDEIDNAGLNTPAYYPLVLEPYWNYTAQPEPNLAGTAPVIAQGRVFGGGSAVNGMAYCRGAASVFDEWAELSGNPGLAWTSLLDDFKATSHYTHQDADFEQFSNVSAYGNGPLGVSQSSGTTGFDIPFLNAARSMFGLEEIDMTDGTGIGFDLGHASINAGIRTRSYARNTFGSLMEDRPNVQMIPGAWVHTINFKGKKAESVSYVTNDGKTHTLKGKEIIVSGGAINTPKLLLQSGIGPKSDLKKLGIKVVADHSDVGCNLYDHPFSIIQLLVTEEILTFWQWSANETQKAIAEEEYATDRSGQLGWNNGFAYGTLRLPDEAWEGVDASHYKDLPEDRPHVMIHYTTVPFMDVGNNSAVTAWASLVQPEASGQVKLASADYKHDPLIYTNYYGTEADRRAILWTYKKLRELLKGDDIAPLVVEEFYPGDNVQSDEDVWAAIQKQTFSFRHPHGTVALGKVLDKNWRVKGLKGIRVVDSSTFPTPPSCHPQADVYAIAHRAARDIKKADGC